MCTWEYCRVKMNLDVDMGKLIQIGEFWFLYSKVDEYLFDLMYSQANIDMCT